MTVLVFANGDLEEVNWIRPYLTTATAIIAADGGTRHLYRLNHPPDVIIGDLDSLTGDVRAWAETAVPQIITHPTAKDETDLELALLYAASHYEEEIAVIGALGGRLDQTLANLLLLLHPALVGRSLHLLTPFERAWLVRERAEIHGAPGDIVSLIPLGGDVHVRATRGLRWALRDEVLAIGPARGISNEMTAEQATITLHAGQLLCIHTSQNWAR